MTYLLLIVGFVLLIKGADIFVDGSSDIAKIFHVPSYLIGLTIVAMGTSLPECSVSLNAALSGNNDIAMSNVAGSNLFNLFMVCGICAIICFLPIEKETLKREFPFSILAGGILLFMSSDFIFTKDKSSNVISRLDGIILLLLFVLFLLVTMKAMLKAGTKDVIIEETDEKPMSMGKCIVYIVIGIIAIRFGGEFVVDSASKIAATFGLSQNVIGLTVVALGTSLPELVTSIVAAKKNEVGMAVGNVVGSNIFNVLLIIGISATVHPIAVTMNSIYDLLYLTITSLGIWIIAYKKQKLTKATGIFMIVIYLAYMVYACIR
jgi:cation:H+ antiporter